MDVTRRQFIRNTVGLTAGAALLRNAQGADAPLPAKPDAAGFEPFSFCVIADPHCSEPTKSGLEQYGNGLKKFFACIKKIEAMQGRERPDFILLAGDIHPWRLRPEHIRKVPVPVHAVAGNHESDKARRQQLRKLFPHDFLRNGKAADYYTFLHKGVKFIGVCDAGAGGDHIGHFSSELIQPMGQCEWLETELTAPGRKILFAHIPPERQGRDRNMYICRNDSRWFNALVRKHGPDAMFFGHLHRATHEYRIGATRCWNVRSCCWNFGKAYIGFLHVRVTSDGIQVREIETGRYAG